MRISSHQYRHANLVFRTCFWQHTHSHTNKLLASPTHSHSQHTKGSNCKKLKKYRKNMIFLYRKLLFPRKKQIPLTQTQQPLLETCVRECGDHSNQSQHKHTHTNKYDWNRNLLANKGKQHFKQHWPQQKRVTMPLNRLKKKISHSHHYVLKQKHRLRAKVFDF